MISIFQFLSGNAGLRSHQGSTLGPPKLLYLCSNSYVCISLLYILATERWLSPHLADFYENIALVPYIFFVCPFNLYWKSELGEALC